MTRRRRPSENDLPLFDFPLDGGAEADAPPAASDVELTKAAPVPPGPAEPPPLEPTPIEPAVPVEPGAQPTLFEVPPAPPKTKKRSAPPTEPAGPLPAVATSAVDARPDVPAADGAAVIEASAPGDASLRARLLGGVADLAVQLVVIGAMAGCARALGVATGWADWPAFALLGGAFSFLYWVVPLAFWGQTPGMGWAGISCRTLDDEPLSFGQTALRWVGAVLTVALAGVPLLLAASGSSLSDRLSQSKTMAQPPGR